MPDFFDYNCDNCGTPFCERTHIMNLALDNLDEEYCLNCLAQSENKLPQAFAEWMIDYIMARDCFKGPWLKFSANKCPRIADKTCCSISEFEKA